MWPAGRIRINSLEEKDKWDCWRLQPRGDWKNHYGKEGNDDRWGSIESFSAHCEEYCVRKFKDTAKGNRLLELAWGAVCIIGNRREKLDCRINSDVKCLNLTKLSFGILQRIKLKVVSGKWGFKVKTREKRLSVCIFSLVKQCSFEVSFSHWVERRSGAQAAFLILDFKAEISRSGSERDWRNVP